jgi:hypothetical protein
MCLLFINKKTGTLVILCTWVFAASVWVFDYWYAWANPFRGQLEGVGPENLYIFRSWSGKFAKRVPFRPKKSTVLGVTAAVFCILYCMSWVLWFQGSPLQRPSSPEHSKFTLSLLGREEERRWAPPPLRCPLYRTIYIWKAIWRVRKISLLYIKTSQVHESAMSTKHFLTKESIFWKRSRKKHLNSSMDKGSISLEEKATHIQTNVLGRGR